MDTDRQTSSGALSRQWSRLLAASWALVAVSVGIVGSASVRTGKPLWWLDGSVAADAVRAVVLCLLMVGVVLAALRGWRLAPMAGIAVALVLAAAALVDLVGVGGVGGSGDGNLPGGSALVMMIVAGAALLASVAAVAGLSPHG